MLCPRNVHSQNTQQPSVRSSLAPGILPDCIQVFSSELQKELKRHKIKGFEKWQLTKGALKLLPKITQMLKSEMLVCLMPGGLNLSKGGFGDVPGGPNFSSARVEQSWESPGVLLLLEPHQEFSDCAHALPRPKTPQPPPVCPLM